MRQALRLFVFCVLASPVFAGTILPTALKPLTIIRQNDIVHVFTAAVDVNYDGVKDATDRPATWQIIDASTLMTQRVLEFPWTTVNTSRPWLSTTSDLMFIAVGDSVNAYVASTQVFGRSFRIPGNPSVSGIYFDEQSQALRVTVRPSFTEPGNVISLSPTGNFITPVGVNPQQIVGYNSTVNRNGFAVVSEGAFGLGDGVVTLFAAVKTTIPVGDTPNHIVVSGDSAYVTVNGSHYVVIIDLNRESAVDTILVGTSGFDGPREAVAKDGRLFVSTYLGDVRIFDIATGARVGFIQHGTKAEGLAVINNTLWVTNAMNGAPGNYAADSGIVVYDLNVATGTPWDVFGVRGPVDSPLTVTPTVASDEVTIMSTFGYGNVTVVDNDGRATILHPKSSSGTSATFCVSALIPSVYTILQGAKMARFIIIR
ncbi:MAG: hypothetical protein SGJ05_10560 [bacterium]|nr:hypothetical protein [bacterium]